MSEYYKNKARPDGLHPSCKTCHLKRTSRWKKENSKDYKEQQKQYRKEHEAERAQYNQEWIKRNPDKHTAIRQRSSLKTQPHRNDYLRRFARANRALFIAYENKRRALKLKCGGSFTAKEWLDLCDSFGNVCLCCKEEKTLHADHVIPLSKGGPNTIDNIQPLCQSCNSKKRVKIVDYRLQFGR